MQVLIVAARLAPDCRADEGGGNRIASRRMTAAARRFKIWAKGMA